MVRPDRPGVRPDRSGQGSGLSGRPDRPAGLRQPCFKQHNFTMFSSGVIAIQTFCATFGSPCTYLVLRDNEIHVLLSRTAKRIHLKVIIPQECAAEECGANFYTV